MPALRAAPADRDPAAMRLLITGSQGNIGRRLMAAFPASTGLDVVAGADIRADLADADWDAPDLGAALGGADAVVHLATSPDPEAPDDVHFAAVENAGRLLRACARHDVGRVVLASSDWAEPKQGMADINVYGHSKRVFEALAAMYAQTGRTAVALRVGWVPRAASEVAGAPAWLRANHWDDARLLAEFGAVLGLAR